MLYLQYNKSRLKSLKKNEVEKSRLVSIEIIVLSSLKEMWWFISIWFSVHIHDISEYYVINWGWQYNPLQYFCLENPMSRGAWTAIVQWVAKSWTWLSNWAHVRACMHTRMHTHTHVISYVLFLLLRSQYSCSK